MLALEYMLDAMVPTIRGGMFSMGFDEHYAEEASVHGVTVDAFWMDRTPVTNRQFQQFVKATGHLTFAEIPPDPTDYPGALPHMLMTQQGVACDYTHTTAAQSATVVACAGGECEGQAPASQQGTSGTEAR
jgi:formylglycine-generating enzyme required for sulfatase activity